MNILSATESLEETGPPAASWVRFLRTYGPTPNNRTLFDEHVTGALGRARVLPISLSSPHLDEIKARVDSGLPGSILIAGTAGDGKTYHCRSLWMHLGGTQKSWAEAVPLKELTLSDGRVALFVKDLSELNEEQGEIALALLEASVLGDENARFLVVAANHGQILERLRDFGRKQNCAHPLRKPIQDTFVQRSAPPERLAIFDLSRTTSRDSLREVISAVAGHPEWNNCERCSLQMGGRVCPISENRKRLLAEDNGQLGQRLGDLVEVARLNGWHLPVRDLLALASNMILGHPRAKEGLLACADIAKIQDQGLVEGASVYENAFGANLPLRRAMSRPVFRALAAFGIGAETTNASDGLLVYGADDPQLAQTFDRLVLADQTYGATKGYIAALQQYLEGDEASRLESRADDFLDRLIAQRRRLFFSLPHKEPGYAFWSLSAFCFAGDYLEMSEVLALGKPASEGVRIRLVKGLNRVMTGLLIENTDKIFVASSGGFTQSRISVLCDTEAPAKRMGGVGMKMIFDVLSGLAALDVSLAPGAQNSASFLLTPVRFEFLCRVAEGALPGSFSNECLEDMLAFKAKLLRKAELLRKHRLEEDNEQGSDDGSLTLNFIDIEQSGHGFSRPVNVRVGA